MGIFDSSTDTSGTQTQDIDLTETVKAKKQVTEEQQQVTKGAAQESTAQQSQQTSSRELLDQQTQALFKQLIGTLAPTVGATGTGEAAGEALTAARELNTRAAGAEEAINARTQSIVGEARREGENRIEQILTQAAQGTGSAMNTIVAGLGAREVSDLETRLGGLEAGLGIQARGAETEERAAGLEGLLRTAQTGAGTDQAAVGNIAQLGGILRGATEEVTQTGEVLSQAEQESIQTQEGMRTLLELINSVTNKTGTVTTTGDSTTTGSPGLLDFVNSASNLLSALNQPG